MTLREKVRAYIEENLTVYEEEAVFGEDDNIFKLGFVNSLFAMKLVTFIETHFNITIDNDDLDLVNFSTVNNIVNLIERKQTEVA